MAALPCHYCGEPGGTKDHIVAKHWYSRRRVNIPQHVAEANKVPACEVCNNRKSHWRSDCPCTLCELAWILMAPYIMPRVKSDIPIITVEKIRSREEQSA